MDCPELGPVGRSRREHDGLTIRAFAKTHGVGTTVVSEFERLGRIPPSGRIRRALERAYRLSDGLLDRAAAGSSVEDEVAGEGTTIDDRLPALVHRLQDLVAELAEVLGRS